MITPFLAGNRGWGPELGESGKLGVGPGAAARSGHHACLPVCLLPSSLACATSRTHLPFGPGGLRSSSHMGPLKTESYPPPPPRPPCSRPDVSVWGWRTAVLSTPGGHPPPVQHPRPCLPCPALSLPRPWPPPRTPRGTPLHPAPPSTRRPGPSGRPCPLTAPCNRMGTSDLPTHCPRPRPRLLSEAPRPCCCSVCVAPQPGWNRAAATPGGRGGAVGTGPLRGCGSCSLLGAGSQATLPSWWPWVGVWCRATEPQTLSAALPLATLTPCHFSSSLCLSLCPFICPSVYFLHRCRPLTSQ